MAADLSTCSRYVARIGYAMWNGVIEFPIMAESLEQADGLANLFVHLNGGWIHSVLPFTGKS